MEPKAIIIIISMIIDVHVKLSCVYNNIILLYACYNEYSLLQY